MPSSSSSYALILITQFSYLCLDLCKLVLHTSPSLFLECWLFFHPFFISGCLSDDQRLHQIGQLLQLIRVSGCFGPLLVSCNTWCTIIWLIMVRCLLTTSFHGVLLSLLSGLDFWHPLTAFWHIYVKQYVSSSYLSIKKGSVDCREIILLLSITWIKRPNKYRKSLFHHN